MVMVFIILQTDQFMKVIIYNIFIILGDIINEVRNGNGIIKYTD